MTALFEDEICFDLSSLEVPGLANLAREVEVKSEQWGFDFVKEKPLPHSDFDWVKVAVEERSEKLKNAITEQEESRASDATRSSSFVDFFSRLSTNGNELRPSFN